MDRAPTPIKPNTDYSWDNGKDYVCVTVLLPGLKKERFPKQGVDIDKCTLDVHFVDKELVLKAEILSGPEKGNFYDLKKGEELDENHFVAMEGELDYKVKDGEVCIKLKKKSS